MIRKGLLLLSAWVFACGAQVRTSEHLSGASSQLRAGPLVLDIYISETAQLFHTVDQISQWSEFSHPQYVRYFESLGGGLDESDRKILAEHAAIRKKYGWGKGPEQVFYTPLDLDDALQGGVARGDLTDTEAATERRVLTHFKSRVDRMISDCRSLDEFVSKLLERKSDLAAFAVQAQRFFGNAPTRPIPFYVIADPDDRNVGGGYNGGTLTLEIPRKGDVYPTLMHELFHAFVQTEKVKIEAALSACPGLDFQTFNEGLAYALSPGLQRTDGSGELQSKASEYIRRGLPLSEAFVRFTLYGLALRPLLKDALADRQQNLDSFLPRAMDAWRVLAELDRARQPH